MEEEKINLVINQIKQDIDLQSAALSDEYYYQSLPLCVIDSVFSIEINYKITRNVVIKYCNYYDLQRIQSRKGELPKIEEQEAISSLLIKYENEGINKFTEEIYDNRNRTSAKSGILKSEAVYEFARVLKKYDIDYL